MVIDMHCHVIPGAYLDRIRKPHNPYQETISTDGRRGLEVITTRSGFAYYLVPPLCRPEALVAEQEAMGLDHALLSPPPTLLHDWLEPAAGRAHCRLVNEGMAELARSGGGRFWALGTVPLQDPEAAVAELEYATGALGLRGVEICTHVAGRNLDEPEFRPFFRRAAALGALVLLHPWYPAGADRMRRYHLFSTVGNVAELAVALGSLVCGGVMDECPGLRIVAAHAGGVFPYVAGRLDRAWRMHPHTGERLANPPGAYLSRFWYDTVTHDDDVLAFLVRKVGSGRVVLGSDSPFHLFDMGEPAPVRRVRGLDSLGRDQQEQILRQNALALLGAAEA